MCIVGDFEDGLQDGGAVTYHSSFAGKPHNRYVNTLQTYYIILSVSLLNSPPFMRCTTLVHVDSVAQGLLL
jgi:hypothetical protein